MKGLFTLCAFALAPAALMAQFSPVRFVEETEFALLEFGLLHDYDGDGDIDMAMCSTEGAGWWRNDGTGGFSPVEWVHRVPFGMYAELLAAGDMDGDGDIDLLSAVNYTVMYSYLNDGTGNFSFVDSIQVPDYDMRDMLLEDLDGDGKADILFGDYFSGMVAYRSSLGDGTFGPEQVIGSLPGAMDLHVADIEGDGDNDVLISGYGSMGCHICVNQGGGVFLDAALLIPSTTDIMDVKTADMNGDGDLDVITAAYTTSRWYPNDGAGQFIVENTIIQEPGLDLWSNGLGDIDGDGDMDAVPATYDGQVPVWYANDGAGNFAAVGALTQATTFRPAFADIDGDGDEDLVQVQRNALWWPNDGTGVMATSKIIAGTLRNLATVGLADMDGDGDQDALAAGVLDDRIVMYANDGTGQFGGQITLLDTMSGMGEVVPGDLDGDGDMDMVVCSGSLSYACFNDGTGSISSVQIVDNDPGTIKGTSVGDVDGDGDLDLMHAEYNPNRIRLWRNTGSGSFDPPVIVFSGFNPTSCDLLDADGDGDLDITSYYGQNTHYFIWIANDGSGSYGAAQVLGSMSGGGGQCSAIALDADADGVRDLVYVSSEGLNMYRGLGGGTFSAAVNIDPNYMDESDAFPIDLDSDGDMDIALAEKSGAGARYYLNGGTGVFSSATWFDATWLGDMASELSIGDLDGDGDPDALVGNMNGQGFYAVGWVENYFNSPYHIDGTLFHDVNENGAQDVGEGPLPFVAVHADPVASVPLTDPDGHYSILTDPGDYEVSVPFPNAWWGLTTSPATYNVQLTTGTPVSTGNDFGYAPIVDTTVVELGIAANIGVCGDTTLVYLNVMNVGTSQPSGTFCGMIDTLFTIISFDPPPTSVTGNMYCWEIDSLYYYTPFTIVAEVVVPDASYMGTLLVGGTQLTETDGQGNVLQTWQEAWAIPLTCSYDPNYKEVEPKGYGEAGAVDIDTERLEYTIHFQNTGTASAQDVVLVDRLAEEIDPSSLQVLAYSHAPTAINLETDRDMVIRFDGIQLPDSGTTFTGSQGFIRFAVDLVPGLPHATVIENTSNIHFDLNVPVITNTTVTTLVDCALAEAAISLSGSIALEVTEGDAYQWYLNAEPIAAATGQVFFPNENGSYTCEVTTTYGCIVMTDPYQVTSVSVPLIENLRLALLPNPMNATARLVFSEALRPGDRVQLLDTRGAEVMSVPGNGASSIVIDRDGLVNGLYMVRVLRAGATLATLRLAVVD